MQKVKTYDYYVGIDPGVNNGYAVYDKKEKKLIVLCTLKFWDLISELSSWKNPDNCCVIIEDTNLNSSLYSKRAHHQGAMRDTVAQNIGNNKRTATLIMEYLKRKGIAYIPKRPTKKSMTKMDAETFKRITGFTESSSEHARDAAMLVFGI